MIEGTNNLGPIDRRLLDALQQAIPLDPCPFRVLAESLGMAEQDVLTRLQRIGQQGFISRISAIFDTRSLGYESVLVAAKYPADEIDRTAGIVNEHPGVSHNYLRAADYNLWYTLAVPPDSNLGLEKTAAVLSHLTRATSYRLLPAERVFKIGVRLPLADEPFEPTVSESAGTTSQPCRTTLTALTITQPLKAAILALQEDLPIEPRPFEAIAGRHKMDVHSLLAAARDLQAAGVMRRYAAVLRHRKAGFDVNCMTVWSVPSDRVEQAGESLAGFTEVTHCYLRPGWPDWPYNLYAMIHCRTDEHCRDLIDRMKAATGITDMLAVYSTREYKKVRLQYFSPAFAEWEQRHGTTPDATGGQ